jgi:hypothetical protein
LVKLVLLAFYPTIFTLFSMIDDFAREYVWDILCNPFIFSIKGKGKGNDSQSKSEDDFGYPWSIEKHTEI